MSDPRAQIKVKLQGREVRKGKVPSEVFVETVQVLQKALYVIGRYELDQKGWTAGRLPAVVREACLLNVVSLSPNSAIVGLELNTVEEPTRFPEVTPDLGIQSIDRLGSFVQAVHSKDLGVLNKVMPDSRSRVLLLRSLREWTRKMSGELSLDLVCGEHQPVTLDGSVGDFVNAVLIGPEEAPVTVIGRVVMITIDPSRYFILDRAGRRINCYFDEDLEDILIPAMGGVVEVSGRGEFKADGSLQSIPEVKNVTPLELRPWVFTEITTPRYRFRLSEPLAFDLTYADGLLLAENRELGILSYGESRKALLDDIGSDLEELWKAYVLAPTEELSVDAIGLREKLRLLLCPVGESPNETSQTS